VVVPPTLPGERILTGTVRNDSLRRLELKAESVRLLDADGRQIEADAGFLGGYVAPDEAQNREPDLDDVSEDEQRRRGRILRLEPGRTAPLSVSWRARRGQRSPVRIDYGPGFLPVR
jgi:hypothetical protein